MRFRGPRAVIAAAVAVDGGARSDVRARQIIEALREFCSVAASVGERPAHIGATTMQRLPRWCIPCPDAPSASRRRRVKPESRGRVRFGRPPR
jgi:hypothetical protein